MIDDVGYAYYQHYNKGVEIFDECPKELHIKRGRDYDQYISDTPSFNTDMPERPACKVRFDDNRSYWYIGDYKVGDLVYVDGAKKDCLGQVKDLSTTKEQTAIYEVLNKIGNVDLANVEEIENIWSSYKPKERKEYLRSLGFEEDITKKKFVCLIENKWIEFAQKKNDWKKFIEDLKKN